VARKKPSPIPQFTARRSKIADPPIRSIRLNAPHRNGSGVHSPRAPRPLPLFLGIDGGGTRTTAWLADERGKVLAKAVTGPSNPLKVGVEACECEILAAANHVVAAGLSRQRAVAPGPSPAPNEVKSPLQAVVVGLAGVDRPQMHGPIFAWLKRAIPALHHVLTSDAAIGLYAAIDNQPAIMVISGTGSIAFAQDPENQRVLRSGGWGIPFDDAGSGYEIARQGVEAALRGLDGRGPHTMLGQMICRELKLRDITEIIPKQLSSKEIAALFPLVATAARKGDLSSRLILRIAANDLALLASALIRRLGWSRREFPLVCSGGVLTGNKSLRDQFSDRVRKSAPRACILLLRKPPVEGALAMAREMSQKDAKQGSATRGISNLKHQISNPKE